jgi:hypothetical protein
LLEKDSSFEHFAVGARDPQVRTYKYTDSLSATIDWWGTFNTGDPLEIVRRDSINAAGKKLDKIKTLFYDDINLPANYAMTESFNFSDFVNPLAKLNISGTIFSLFYTSVLGEILGNSYHKAIYNSNILPFYMDFASPNIPLNFYIGGYLSSGYKFSGDAFDIQITPWTQRSSYPSSISVGATTALWDRVVYRYFY